MFSSGHRDAHLLKPRRERTEDQAQDLIIRVAEIPNPGKVTSPMLSPDWEVMGP